jgi:hypothetical protein
VVDGAGGRKFTSLNPADIRKTVANVSLSEKDVDCGVRRQGSIHEMASDACSKAGRDSFRAGELLVSKRSSASITGEMGKVLPRAWRCSEAIDMAFYMAGRGWLQGETAPSELYDKDCKTVREPIRSWPLLLHGIFLLPSVMEGFCGANLRQYRGT